MKGTTNDYQIRPAEIEDVDEIVRMRLKLQEHMTRTNQNLWQPSQKKISELLVPPDRRQKTGQAGFPLYSFRGRDRGNPARGYTAFSDGPGFCGRPASPERQRAEGTSGRRQETPPPDAGIN